MSRPLYRALGAVVALLFVGALVACSAPGVSTSAHPTPTSALPVGFALYHGDKFTITYPRGWKASADTTKNFYFVDVAHHTGLILNDYIQDANGSTSPDESNKIMLDTYSFPPAAVKPPAVPATTEVGGVAWKQGSTSNLDTMNPVGTPAKFMPIDYVVLSTNYPAKSPATHLFTIIYEAPAASFERADSQYFQPMLRSFHFL